MEMKRGMHAYPNFPGHVKIEIVSGCNRHCAFCGINNDGKPEIISSDLFQKILNELSAHSNEIRVIDCAMHGESTLDKNLVNKVNQLRKVAPFAKIMMTTNADALLCKEKLTGFSDLFEAGMDYITFDIYDEKARSSFNTALSESPEFKEKYRLVDFYETHECQYSSGKPKTPTLIFIDETSGFNNGSTPIRDFNTQGGNVPFDTWEKGGIPIDKFPMIKTCAEPLKYIAIRASGNVPACCADGSNAITLGNINTQTIEEVWKGVRMNTLRYVLKNGRRDVVPSCYACNRISFRDGLWPLHTEEQYDLVRSAETFTDADKINGRFKENLLKLYNKHGIANRFIRKALGLEEQ